MSLDATTDSAAHIIPNALGGRLKPKGLICRRCNTELDDLADNALVRAFGDWPTLLDIPRDHGGQPPRTIETRHGKRVRVEADGTMTAVDIVYDVQPIGEGHAVEIAAGDIKTMRQLLQRAQKQYPQFDAAIAEKHLQTAGLEESDELRMSIDASPKAVFGGVVTASWLFVLDRTGHRLVDWARLKQVIANVQQHGGTFRFMPALPGLQGPEIRFGHKLAVRSTPKGELITYLELCGVLKIGGVLAVGPPSETPIEHLYVYDLEAQKDRSSEFAIDAAEFDLQDWRTIGLGPGDAAAVREAIRSNQEAVFAPLYAERFKKS